MHKLKLGELCAGYGGLGLAVEEALNAELAWYSEFDAAPSKIMATHWPDVPNHGDMTQIDWSAIEPVDIISGGTPCQDLSAAGRRKGMTEGTRSNLWVNMREAIATIKPTYVVWENVRGAYSAKAVSDLEFCPGCMGSSERADEHVLRALGRVLGDLSDLGYDTQWRGLRAADVGAPHGRFRVFVLATRRDAAEDTLRRGSRGRGAQSVVGEGGEPHIATLGTNDRPSRPDAIATITEPANSDEPGLEGQRDSNGATPSKGHGHSSPGIDNSSADSSSPAEREYSGEPSSEKARSQGRYGSGDPRGERHAGDGREVASDAGGDESERRRGRGDLGSPAPTSEGADGQREWIRHATVNSRPAATQWGDYAPAIRRWEAVRGTSPAPTELTAKGKHRLSARFAEWMMGIPAGWVTGVDISRNDQLKAIGNGVVPQQAVAAIRDMIAANQESKEIA